jgi:hypothetical protein
VLGAHSCYRGMGNDAKVGCLFGGCDCEGDDEMEGELGSDGCLHQIMKCT